MTLEQETKSAADDDALTILNISAEMEDWKHAVLEKVDNCIKSLSSNLKYHKVNVSLSNEEVKSCLSELQSKYVITPIDKANGNIAFI